MDSILPPTEERFHQNVVGLSQLVYDLVSNAYSQGYKIIQPAMVEFASLILNSYDKKTLIETFIKHSHKHWDQIKRREESFFDKNCHDIFKGLPMNNVDAFKKLFTLKNENGEHVIKQDDRDAIWDFFESLIKISINHIHQNRKPTIKTSNNGTKEPIYTQVYFNDIDLNHHANVWNVKRRFT